MTRGNQRDLARAKNAKKLEALKKAKGSGKDVDKRKERDADVMREKQRKAEEKRQNDLANADSGQSSKKKVDPLLLK